MKETIQNGVLIVNEKPPVWDRICEAFGMTPKNVIFAYGDRIYNPGGGVLPDFLIEHEKVHFKQQAGEVAVWWDKYLSDPQFRLEQEIEAYAHQYNEMCKLTKDRNEHAKMLWGLSISLSSSIYNNIISHNEAMEVIQKLAKNI